MIISFQTFACFIRVPVAVPGLGDATPLVGRNFTVSNLIKCGTKHPAYCQAPIPGSRGAILVSEFFHLPVRA